VNPAPEQIRRGRLKLGLLALFFAAPFVLAWLAWRFDWASGATSNYGELITPARPVAGAPLERLRGKWVLVSFDAGACDAYCERKLYFMRQVRRAQGKNQDRVARLWLVTGGGRPHPEVRGPIALVGERLLGRRQDVRGADDALEAFRVEHPAPAGALAARFPAAVAVADHIYVIDPLGNLMMRYPREPDPSRMLKDLQRLLRVAGFG